MRRHVRRLAATARLAAIFGLALAAGVAGYFWLGRSARVRSETGSGAPARPTASVARQATPPYTNAQAAALAPSPGLAKSPSTARAEPVAPHSTAADAAAAHIDRADEGDRLSRKTARGLLERTFKGKLTDRELQDRDYDRLTDAVLRLRSALRILRHGNGTAANTAVLDRQRQIMLSALAEIERITGVPPSSLGEVLTSDDESDLRTERR